MLRKLFGALTAVVAVNCIAAGAALLWPNTARSIGSQALTAHASAKADIDQVFASVTRGPHRASIPAFLIMIDFERVFAGENALPRRDYIPVVRTAIDFEGTFGSVTAARRENSPPNREKLRNAGWKRILASG